MIPALLRKVSRGGGGGYSGYGYRSYSFPGGGKLGVRELTDCKYVYIDYKYIIIYIYNLFLKTKEGKGDSENCNFCNRNRFYRKITLPRPQGNF